MGDKDKFIKDTYGDVVIYSKEICKKLTELYELFTREVIAVQQNTGLRMQVPEIYFVKSDRIGG